MIIKRIEDPEEYRVSFIKVKDFDTFINDKNTIIFLKCYSPKLKTIWDKPSFPIDKFGYNPHITLYDGPTSQFSKDLLKLLQNYKNYSFKISNPVIENLQSKSYYKNFQDNSLKLLEKISREKKEQVFCKVDSTKRIEIIDKILKMIYQSSNQIHHLNCE